MARKKKAAPKSKDAPFEKRLAEEFREKVRLASSPLTSDITTFIDTGAAELHWALGIPGIPAGRITVFYGKEGSGKSTLTLHVLAETQRRGGTAILIDAEHRYSRDRAERIGIDPETLVMVQPTTLEGMFDDLYKIMDWIEEEDPGRLVCVVVDSISALPTKKLLESDPGDHGAMGLAARIISQQMERLNPLVAKCGIAMIFVGQLRSHIAMVGNPRSRERRKVMRDSTMVAEGTFIYYGSLFIHFTSIGIIGDRDEPTGITAKVRIRKNSIAPEDREVLLDIYALDGIDGVDSKLKLLERIGTVTRAGSWYKYGDTKFQKRNFEDVLAEHPELEDAIAAAPSRWLKGLDDADEDPKEEE